MQRAIAKAVRGNQVLADGRWLTCIGNKNVKAGAIIWTDGRCIYGNQAEGGNASMPILPTQGIPVFGIEGKYQYFAKGALHEIGSGKEHRKMLNDKKKYIFFNQGDYVLDAEFDEEGNLYTLEGGGVDYNFEIMDYESFGHCRLARNGKTLIKFDILPILKRQSAKAVQLAESLKRPIKRDDPGSQTMLGFTQSRIIAGKVDAAGNYVLVVNTWAGADHHEWAYYTVELPFLGSNTYIIESWSASDCQQRSLLTEEGEEIYMERELTNARGYGEDYYHTTQWDAPAGSIRLPLQDGYFCIFDGKMDMHYPSSGGDYTGKIYNAAGELVLTGKFDPFMNLSICPVGAGRYLIGTGYFLYLYADGTFTKLMDACGNFRLRKMNNLSRWKKERG